MTGVIVRSAANVTAGAKTRMSAILHGVWLVATVALATTLLRLVPTTALAGVLVYTGYKLISPAAIRKLWHHGIGELAIFLLTGAVVVGEDLLTGVIVGTICSAARLLWQLANLTATVQQDEQRGETHLTLSGAATFIKLPKLAAVFDSIPPGSAVRVDLSGLRFVDTACRELLESWHLQHLATGGTLVVQRRGPENAGDAAPANDKAADAGSPMPLIFSELGGDSSAAASVLSR
jgi:MFS superfamily sulfate permease-like transporter